ncbi:MAG: TonB-dependent receptor [Curvibacter sp.]|nr:TonB-dependent receptor [Curvibacter sp.]
MKNSTRRPRALAPAPVRLALWPLVSLFGAGLASAQTAPAPLLGETVVTATRTEQPLADLVADVSLIDHQTLERSGAVALADVLARVPGVEIARNGGPAGTTSVFLRGADTAFTAVFIDGVRVDSQGVPGATWESIPLGLIDHIEILRGPAAAVYGSDALGGVIQIFTRKGEGAPQPYVEAGVGSYATSKVQAGVSGSSGAFDYALGVQRERSAGFNSIPSAAPAQNDGYTSNAGHARLGFQINPDQRLEASLLAHNLLAGFNDGYGDPQQQSSYQLRTTGLNLLSRWSPDYKTVLGVSESTSLYAVTTAPDNYLSNTRVRSYLFQNEWRLGSQQFTAALERREDHVVTSDPVTGNRFENALALGWGLHWQQHTVQLNLRHDQDSTFGGHNSGSASYGYAITPAWRATVSAGTAFRAPTVYQLYGPYGVSSLQPETSHNLEAGLRYAQGASRWGVVAYRNQVGNLINFSSPGACSSSYGCYANVAHARYTGVTFTGEERIGAVSLHGSLDLQDPKNLDTGALLARRARQHGTFGADTLVANWSLGAEVQASGRRYDNAANTRPLGGYTLFNLYASTAVARDWQLLARVDNLADKQYQLANTYATPGRSVYLGLKWAPQN